jgi:hypothetical protein
VGVVALRRSKERQGLGWQMVIEGNLVFGPGMEEQGHLHSRLVERLAIV